MLPRHSWVWLQPAAWSHWLAALPTDQHAPLQRWARQLWPLIVRRLPENQQAIGLGLSLPPEAGMRPKLAWQCQPADILQSQHALEWPQLAALMQTNTSQGLPSPHFERWQSALQELDQALAGHHMRLGFYGSLAWQAWTGLPYLHAQSDIDIYVRVSSRSQLDRLLTLLAPLARSGLPLDGEIGFPGERAVAWREWLQAGSGKVLVKQQQVGLLERRILLESLA